MNKKKKIIIFCCFILLFVASCSFFAYGNDYYWHVKIGEYIFNNKAIPYTDIFSWYGKLNHLHWISHEWLSEVIIFLFTKFFHYGAFIFTLSTIISIGIFIFYKNRELFYKQPFYAILWSLIGCIILLQKILPRPHLISYLLFTITIYIAYDLYKNKNSKKIYISFIIAILWGNCHGGSSNLSYFIYSVFFILSLFDLRKGKITNEKKDFIQSKKYFIAIILSIIGICINPHGLKMLIYPYQNMTYTKMINCIIEWQSLKIFSIDGIFYVSFILYVLISLIKSKKNIYLIDLILFLFFTILGIKSVKFMPYLYIVVSYFIFNYIKPLKREINVNIILVFLVFMNIFLFKNIKLKDTNIIPNKIINYLSDNQSLKLYNSYSTGGYLIYKNIEPFIDGRADLYIDTIFSDCCNIEQGKTKILEKYDFDLFLVKKKEKAYYYLLKNNNKYKLIMNNKKYYLFKKIQNN